MIGTLVNWAIFGVAAIGWNYATTWATSNGNPELAMLSISLITMSLMVGKTSGGNGIEHIISGVKGCLNMMLGWLVAAIVYNVIYALVYTGGLDVNALLYAVIGAIVVVFSAVVTFSAVNAVRN